MKRSIMVVGLILLLASAPAMAQMMGGGQQQQAFPQQQYYPNQMHPGMMGGYGGYGMGPGMMGNYGYGMGPGMMGAYSCGIGPGMMGGYGYGMGPNMLGAYGRCPHCGGIKKPYFKDNEEYSNFLNQTKAKRQKLHNLMFEYGEAMRSPEPDRQKLQEMEKEMNELRNEIVNYKLK